MKRLRELEKKENARLKKLVANQALDIDVPKGINAGKWKAQRARGRWSPKSWGRAGSPSAGRVNS